MKRTSTPSLSPAPSFRATNALPNTSTQQGMNTMTCSAAVALTNINLEIGDAEATADRAFFERLLAPAFSMGRPDGVRFDDRATFLDSLAAGPPRYTRIESTTVFDNRAVVVCAVSKAGAAGPLRFRNIRVFTRKSSDSGWQLVSWVNEPLTALGTGDGLSVVDADRAQLRGGA